MKLTVMKLFEYWIFTTALITTILPDVRLVAAADVEGLETTYRAAVVEFEPLDDSGSDQHNLQRNARRAADYAHQAGILNVDIMVFPEYGLLASFSGGATREGFASGTQDIPNPKTVTWNPCLEPAKFPNEQNEVLRILSCASHNNSVVIVANLLGRQPCTASSDPKCPADGQYLYNTNVVFGKNGTLIARYRKYHLYGEDMLDQPTEPEYAIFDVGFATFGTFVCWDIFFEEPAVKLVNRHGIRNLVFSTAWTSELPFITSTQNMAQFAHGVGANLLASNLYFQEGSEVIHLGSGIYSSLKGALNETLDLATPGHMIVADVPVNPPEATVESTTTLNDCGIETPSVSWSNVTVAAFPKPDSCGNSVSNWTGVYNFDFTNLPTSNRALNKSLKVYNEPITKYSYVELIGEEGQAAVCQDNLCCKAAYEFKKRHSTDTYVLAVRNGCRIVGKYSIGLQVCAVMRCKHSLVTDNINDNCGRVSETQPASRFKNLRISGIFQSKYIYPNVFSTTFANVLRDHWNFSKQLCQEEGSSNFRVQGMLEATTSFSDYSVLVASMYGRMYEWD